MASQQSPDHFDDTDLAALQVALEDIWTTLKANDPSRHWDRENELKTRIAEKLMALPALGVREPEELRRRGLETLPSNWHSRKRGRSGNEADGSLA